MQPAQTTGATTFIQNNTIVGSQSDIQSVPKGWFINSMRRKKKELNEVSLDEYPEFNELKEDQFEDEQRAKRAAKSN